MDNQIADQRTRIGFGSIFHLVCNNFDFDEDQIKCGVMFFP